MDKCNKEIFEKGHSVALLTSPSGTAEKVEEWVKLVAAESGQRMDWHNTGGRRHVLVLGDHAAALAAAKRLAPLLETFEGYVLCWYEDSPRTGEGAYRDGVTPLPPGVIAVVS